MKKNSRYSYFEMMHHTEPAPNWFTILVMIVVGAGLVYGLFYFLPIVLMDNLQ